MNAHSSYVGHIGEQLRILSTRLCKLRRQAARRRPARLVDEATDHWLHYRVAEAMRAARRAASCRFGPGRRDGRLACSHMSSAQQ
eukprot:1550644-Pyramimonas_sp.AAC.1